MQSAAGGTSQRLKPALAIVCSLSRIPAPAPGTVPALLIVVIVISPCSRPLWALLPSTIPLSSAPQRISSHIAAPHNSRMRQDRQAHSRTIHPGHHPLCQLRCQLRRNLACPGTVLCPAQKHDSASASPTEESN